MDREQLSLSCKAIEDAGHKLSSAAIRALCMNGDVNYTTQDGIKKQGQVIKDWGSRFCECLETGKEHSDVVAWRDVEPTERTSP